MLLGRIDGVLVNLIEAWWLLEGLIGRFCEK